MQIKFNPESTGYRWTAYGSAGLKYDYKAPDGTVWNADSCPMGGQCVLLWTINAYGQVHHTSINMYEFERTWTRIS